MLAKADQDNVVYGDFPAKRRLCGLGQHCISNFLVQYCLRRIRTTLNIRYSYAMLFQLERQNICIGYFAKKSCLLTMGQHCTGKVLAQCWPTLIKLILQIIFLSKVALGLWVNISQVIFLCNVGTGRSRQHCIGFFPAKTCLRALGQHCTSNFQTYLDNIDQTIFLRNVVPAWSIQHCIGYLPHKSYLFAMGQHCKGDFLVQCWPRNIQTLLQIIFLCIVVCGLCHDRWVK